MDDFSATKEWICASRLLKCIECARRDESSRKTIAAINVFLCRRKMGIKCIVEDIVIGRIAHLPSL